MERDLANLSCSLTPVALRWVGRTIFDSLKRITYNIVYTDFRLMSSTIFREFQLSREAVSDSFVRITAHKSHESRPTFSRSGSSWGICSKTPVGVPQPVDDSKKTDYPDDVQNHYGCSRFDCQTPPALARPNRGDQRQKGRLVGGLRLELNGTTMDSSATAYRD